MGDYSNTFDWVQFPEGRARFAGATRGWDEKGHDTFAVELDGIEYYGEIAPEFLPDHNNFNVEIISFGFPDEIFAGSTPASWQAFSADQLRTVQSLVLQLVRAGLEFEIRPSYLNEFPNSNFMGMVSFRRGWALQAGSDGNSLAESVSAEVAL